LDSIYKFSVHSGNIEPNATLVIESDKGTETSFLCFRANSGMEIYIKSITIEYQ